MNAYLDSALSTDRDGVPSLTLVLPPDLGKDQTLAGLAELADGLPWLR